MSVVRPNLASVWLEARYLSYPIPFAAVLVACRREGALSITTQSLPLVVVLYSIIYWLFGLFIYDWPVRM